MNSGFRVAGRWLAMVLLTSVFGSVVAAAPSSSDEQRAKQAVPASGKALLYIYRKQDSGDTTTVVSLNGSEVARLESQTFGLWNVEPGRNEIRAGGKTLVLQCESGRIYFVELTRATTGAVVLRQVSYALGRTQTHQARLAGSAPPARSSSPAPARPTPPAAASEPRRDSIALAIKTGSFKMTKSVQALKLSAVDTSTQHFDASVSSPLAIEGEGFIFSDSFSIGGEYLHYSADFTSTTTLIPTAAPGKMDTKVYLLNAKYYFRSGDDTWRPYIGAGLGGATASFSGALRGDLGGLAMQALIGMQWRWQHFGVRAVYKYLKANVQGKNDVDDTVKTDASGNGIFIGASVYF